MTAVCGGGPSSVRPGVVGQAFNTASGIASFLSEIMDARLATAIGAIAALETFDVANYCAVDPPADPGLTPSDMLALLNPADLNNYLPAVTKVRVWWRHLYWWQVCQCTTVATPAPPAPSNPGAQSNNQGLPSGGDVNCYTSNAGYTTVGVTSGHTNLDLGPIWLPPTIDTRPVTVTFPSGPVSGLAYRMPANVTSFNFTSKNGGATSPAPINALDASILFFDATGVQKDAQQFLTSQNIQLGPLGGAPRPVGAPSYAAILGQNNADASVSGKVMSWDVEFRYICGGDGIASPCCPPDPALELKINQVLQLLLNLQNPAVNNPPISWHDGARHTLLRGAGSFSINPAAIGMRFEVTTPPTGAKVDPGNPDFYWDMGFWSPYALTSPMRGGRIVFLRQSVELPEFTDQIGYTLKNGTVMDAVELLPTTA